jgi:hypothetical protein
VEGALDPAGTRCGDGASVLGVAVEHVHERVGAPGSEGPPQGGRVGGIALVAADGTAEVGATAAEERQIVPARDELIDDERSKEPGAAEYEDSHETAPPR